MRRVLLLACAFLLTCVTALPAAGPMLSFAGAWTLVSGSDINWGLGREFTAAQDDKNFTVVRKPSGSKATYHLDGSDNTNPVSIGGLQIPVLSQLKRAGDKLVLTATYRASDFDITLTQTWSLEPSGELTIESDYVQGGRPIPAKSTFKKN